MNVAIVAGSVRKGRQSHKAAYYLNKELIKRGVNSDLIDPIQNPLPALKERVAYHPEPPEKAVELSERFQKADALILVTPEYHGSFSGVLKNMMDYFNNEFKKKPIGVVAASGGDFSGINASSQLQHVILSIGAYPLPKKLLIGSIHHAFNESFVPQTEEVVKSANEFLDELLWFSDALTHKKDLNKAV